MSAFPTLKTGAVLQYPAQRATYLSTPVLRFVDGSEQRFRGYATPLHRWIVRLDLLDEVEVHQLREFFRIQGGAGGTFAFTDPWDGANYPNCSVLEDTMVETLLGAANVKTSLTVRENRS
jgi:hypothetical protein